MLTERQRVAAAVMRELDQLGMCWVVSPLPLDPGTKLRVQILDSARNKILQRLRDMGHDPRFVSMLPRVTPDGMILAEVYEFDPLPSDSVPIVVSSNRTIYGEVAEPKGKPSAEVAGMRKALNLDYVEKKR